MFRTFIYPSSGACDCVDELPHWSSCSQFVVCWSFWCGCYLVVFVLQAEAQHVEHIISEIKQQVTSSWSFIRQLSSCLIPSLVFDRFIPVKEDPIRTPCVHGLKKWVYKEHGIVLSPELLWCCLKRRAQRSPASATELQHQSAGFVLISLSMFNRSQICRRTFSNANK